MTTQSGEKEKTKRIHWWLGIILCLSLILAVMSYLEYDHWFYLAGICISSFFLSLVCMDYMTYNARAKLYNARAKLNKETGARRGEIEKLMNNLPPADKIASIFPEPIEVLDRHEIRRALVISLTIVYFILLFQGSSMMKYFTWVYFSVIAFYFGSRGLEKYAELRKATERA